MTAANDRKPTITKATPRVTFKWPKLNEPDYGTKDYPKPDGEFSVKAVFDMANPAHVKFREEMNKVLEAAVEKGREEFSKLKVDARKKLKDITINDIFKDIYDEETEEETGKFEMKVAMKASGTFKKGPKAGKSWKAEPALFDSLGQKFPKSVPIWGGTEGVISFTFEPEGYFIAGTGAVGVATKLKAVQVIRLASGGERSAEDYGFQKHDDGFVAPTHTPEQDDTSDEFAGQSNHSASDERDF